MNSPAPYTRILRNLDLTPVMSFGYIPIADALLKEEQVKTPELTARVQLNGVFFDLSCRGRFNSYGV